MSRKDGKAVLLKSEDKKGFHTSKVDNEFFDANVKAAEACPVNIIKVKMI
jgi:ferredoxin